MTLFNYFTVLAGLMSAGIASALQSDGAFAVLGAVLGILLALLSFVFWKLDQRVSFLIKHGEDILSQVETRTLPAPARIFTNEPTVSATAAARTTAIGRVWTFGSSFRLVFLAAGLIGVSCSGLAALKASGIVSIASRTVAIDEKGPASINQQQLTMNPAAQAVNPLVIPQPNPSPIGAVSKSPTVSGAPMPAASDTHGSPRP